MRLVVLALLASCTGTQATLQIDLATAPGSMLLSSVERVRLTLTNPPAVFEAERTASGIDLSFEIDAVEDNGVIWIEGFDASGASIVAGQSPPFALAGTDSTVSIFVAPSYSILSAPVTLEPARSHVGAAALVYGAVVAGGTDEAGAPSASMAIYNAYNHSFGYGENMPVPRAGPTLAANDTFGVYVFGGTDETAAPTSTLHRFQTNIAPDGSYSDLGAHPGLESAGQRAVEVGPDAFFVTGGQPLLIADSTVTAITSFGDVTSAAAALTPDRAPIAAFLQDGIYTVGTFAADGTIDRYDLPSPIGFPQVVAGKEPGTLVVVGGATRHVYFVELASRTVTEHVDTLSVTRRSPTVAATARHILVANGLDHNGAPNATADILDATTLDLIATVPLAPRANTIALPLPNDQIMIVGGDEVTNLVELFTPPVPSSPASP